MSQADNHSPQTDSSPPQRIAFGTFAALVVAVAGLLAACADAPVLKSRYTVQEIAQAARHDAYDTLYAAQLVVVGTVVKRDGPIAAFPGNTESHPEWILVPKRFLYLNKRFAQKSEEYWTNGGVPDADLEKKPYLFARGFGEQQVYLGPASEELLDVATIAVEQRRHDDAVLLHQAKTNPASHPLFQAIRTGKNVATVDVIDDSSRSISIDRAGNVEEHGKIAQHDMHVVLLAANMRGTLPENASVGTYLRISQPLPKPVESQPLIVVWELKGGIAHAIHVETTHEATLRIAAAAMKRSFEDFSFEAHGPQHGSSRGWEGPVDDHHETGLGEADPNGEEER